MSGLTARRNIRRKNNKVKRKLKIASLSFGIVRVPRFAFVEPYDGDDRREQLGWEGNDVGT
jgi:hypothetical protein